MQLNLDGKIALITGSSRGIGRTIAKGLHTEGNKVALNSRNTEELVHVTTQLSGAIAVAGDVTQPAEAHRVITDVVKSFGKLDIVVCNVGSGQSVPQGEETSEERQRVFALNLWVPPTP